MAFSSFGGSSSFGGLGSSGGSAKKGGLLENQNQHDDLQPLRGYGEAAQEVWAWECDHREEREGRNELPAMQESRMQLRAAYSGERLAELWAATLEGEVNAGPLAFVEALWFQSIVGCVIAANALIIGIETDLQSPIWSPIEQALLIFFVAELVLRICHHGDRFLWAVGNIFDVFIVTAGVFDMWCIPLVNFVMGRTETGQSAFMSTIQMLRLLRIIRLIRLVKIVQPLYRLALGIAEAIQGMFWVLIFLAMMLYAMAVVLTRIVGHDSMGGRVEWHGSTEDSDEVCSGGCSLAALEVSPDEVRAMFSSVTSSMFVLFESMSCWSLMRFRPLFEKMPVLRLCAVVFYIFAAWALLAVMTGVVSEKMIAAREKMNTESKDREQERGIMAAQVLEQLFRKADADDSGEISREEFNTMLMWTDVTKQLMQHTSVNAQDLGDLFEWLDHDKDGVVSTKEFLDGFRWLNDTISPKTFLKLQEGVAKDLRMLQTKCTNFINERFDALIDAVSQPLRKIHAVTEQIQRLDVQLCTSNPVPGHETLEDLCQGLRRDGPPTRAALEAMEQRLDKRLDELMGLVEDLATLQSKGCVTWKPP